MANKQFLYWAYLIIIGGIFYFMNLYTPLYSDDWNYCFIFGTQTPIQTICDILESQYTHYFEMNGRFTPHFIVQFFDGITGKYWFNIANAIMFIIMLLLICKTIVGNNKTQYYKIISLATLGIFFFMPGFNYNFLWMSGACNYLWSIVLFLTFNLLLHKEIHNKFLYIPLLLWGIICGWTHEGIVVGLSIGYFIYYLLNKEKLKPTSTKLLLIGFYIGTALLVFSPGSISRAMQSNPTESFSLVPFVRGLISSLINMDNIILLPLLIILLGILYFTKHLQLKEYINTNIIWTTAIIINFLFVLLTKHANAYSRFGFEFICLILIIKTIYQIKIPSLLLNTTNTIIILFLSLVILPISANNYHEFNHIKSQIEKNENNGIILTSNIDDIIPNQLRQYFIHYISVVGLEYDTPFKGHEWIDNYFNKGHFIFIPKDLFIDVEVNPNHYNQFYTNEKLTFYAKRLNRDETNIKHVHYQLKDLNSNEIPFYHKPFANRMERYTAKTIEIDSKYYSIININNTPYLLVGKNYLIDHRVLNIIYE